MYTQCPDCHTVYAVDAATVAQAHGEVGCGQCGATFNALTTLAETWPDDGPERLPTNPTSPGPPILMVAATRTAAVPESAQGTAERHEASAAGTTTIGASDVAAEATMTEQAADATAGAAPDDAIETAASTPMEPAVDAHDAIPEVAADATVEAETVAADAAPAPLPSFVRRARAAQRPRHRLAWGLGCLVLALVLGAQLVWAERVPLTADATTRPWLSQACAWFGCRLPPVRDLADLEILSRDVRPHPNVPNALLISATLRNDAPFTQPYPVVSITLSDLDANRIAMRRFRPSEYIVDPKVRAAGLAPGATAALMFEVKDPGRNAVAFQFGFQ